MAKKTKFEALASPPVIEAVLDIVTSLKTDDKDTASLVVKDKKFLKAFPKKRPISFFETAFAEGDSLQITHKNGQLGYTYISADECEQTQFRITGFSFHRLQPYTGWDDFIASSLKYWGVYKKTYPNAVIERVGLRFINALEVPKTDNFDKYFNTLIKKENSGLLEGISSFQYRYEKQFADTGCVAVVNFGTKDKNHNEKQSFVFDIDVIRQINSGKLEEKKLLEYLGGMREIKNTIFFETLTKKALQQYK